MNYADYYRAPVGPKKPANYQDFWQQTAVKLPKFQWGSPQNQGLGYGRTIQRPNLGMPYRGPGSSHFNHPPKYPGYNNDMTRPIFGSGGFHSVPKQPMNTFTPRIPYGGGLGSAPAGGGWSGIGRPSGNGMSIGNAGGSGVIGNVGDPIPPGMQVGGYVGGDAGKWRRQHYYIPDPLAQYRIDLQKWIDGGRVGPAPRPPLTTKV